MAIYHKDASPLTRLNIWRHRRALAKTAAVLEKGELTIGFIGGSITDARARHNWPEPVIAWLVRHYPEARIRVENAAIGATGSELAVFRAEKELVERGCQLVFVDYAVNDGQEPSDKRMRTREGLLRKLLRKDLCDVVLVYTYSQAFYQEMMRDAQPASIAEFERLAERYGLGSVWMGLYALEEIRAGALRWEEWLPDGLHPTERGSLSYANSVIAFLAQELAGDAAGQTSSGMDSRALALPDPLHPLHWEQAHAYPLERVERTGPWVVRRWPHLEWIDQVLETSAVGAGLSFAFRGRGLSLGFDFGRTSAEFRYRIDGGDWITAERDRPDWCGDDGWYRIYSVVDDLAFAEHRFELEVIHGDRPECTGTNFRLALIGVVE